VDLDGLGVEAREVEQLLDERGHAVGLLPEQRLELVDALRLE
jgi:hypothetical protein